MTDLVEYNFKKMEVANAYKEYVALLEYLEYKDLNDLRKLNNLSMAHSEAANCQMKFTRYLRDLHLKKG